MGRHMKQTVLTTPSGQEILVQEVPSNTYACEIYEGKLIAKRGFEFSQQWDDHKLPEGNWQGKRLGDYTEDECKEFVETTHMYNKHQVASYKYRSYIDGFVGFKTAKYSFYSFLESKGIDTQNNPFIAINRK